MFIDGLSITREKKKASEKIGWVPELPIFETNFKALNYYVYLAGYYRIPPGEARKMGREALETLDLGDALNTKLAAYSQGDEEAFCSCIIIDQ
jgi:ABC-2 type transport system ATP-binding protein